MNHWIIREFRIRGVLPSQWDPAVSERSPSSPGAAIKKKVYLIIGIDKKINFH